MRQSQLFTKTRKEAPKDEVARNAELLIRGGYINKEMAGVYSYLPLGLRVFKKIEQIVREEMDKIGGQEMLMTTLQDPAVWKKTSRWSDEVVDNWFKSTLKSGGEVGIANTHEEPLAQLLTHYVSSYKDLPLYIYQFQTKFRNELRAKSGIMRTREFVMKDLYSFNTSEKEMKEFYEACAKAYLKIFERVGLGDITYRTAAAGGSFTTGLTDEFQTVAEAGEDTIYIDEQRRLAINKEVYTDEVVDTLGLNKEYLQEKKAIEVGNIFPLGTKYPDALGLTFRDEAGKKKKVHMGSYGIGLGRLMGVIVETQSDEKGIVWPESVAPFAVHLIELRNANDDVAAEAREFYRALTEAGVEVLWDDREARAGEKFADSELLGVPLRVVVSEKTLSEGTFECTERKSGKTQHLSLSELQNRLTHA